MIDTPQITRIAARQAAVIRFTIPREEIRTVAPPEGPNLWESYSAGPESNPDPATWRTELNRPLADS